MVAILASQAYAVAIRLRTGDELGRPPFLTARVLADGSVRFIPESVDMNVLARMATISGGEVASLN